MIRYDTANVSRRAALAVLVLGLFVVPATVSATTYDVGTGQKYPKLGDVPWYTLKAGDTVYIHYQTTAYHEKILISGRGTPSQWIRVLGVPGPAGELPIISGDNATTSTNNHHYYKAASGSSAIQWNGVVQIAVSEEAVNAGTLPGYIEIANLRVQDGYSAYRFVAENGAVANYDDFSACIYARSAQHIVIRNSIMTNCGLGFYNWTGSGTHFYDGLQVDTNLRGNYFYNNGISGSYFQHQSYTESDGLTIESNRYGPQRSGSLGSQIKDRSAGTVIRYNYIEQSAAGWDLDLVDPQESYAAVGANNSYLQTFVYGNIILNQGVTYAPDIVHWNQDSGLAGHGRADRSNGRLFFYHNTIVNVANAADEAVFYVFNTTEGGFNCPSGAPPGAIDVRNNIFVLVPRTSGAAVPQLRFAYCTNQNFSFAANWVSPGWITNTTGSVSGTDKFVSPSSNASGFVAVTSDLHLTAVSSARGIGTVLAPEVIANYLGIDFTPTSQYVYHQTVTIRSTNGQGSDAGAFSYDGIGSTPPSAPKNLRIIK